MPALPRLCGIRQHARLQVERNRRSRETVGPWQRFDPRGVAAMRTDKGMERALYTAFWLLLGIAIDWFAK
jgi:hypothetical protein